MNLSSLFKSLPALTTVRRKLFLITATLLVPATVLLGLLYLGDKSKVEALALKANGLKSIDGLRTLTQHILDLRDQVALAEGDPNALGGIESRKSAVSADITRIDADDLAYGGVFGTTRAWAVVKDSFQKVSREVSTPAAGTAARLDTVVAQVLKLSRQVADASTLVLDDDRAGYYMQDILLGLLDVSDQAAYSRLLSTRVAAAKAASQADRNNLLLRTARLSTLITGIENSLDGLSATDERFRTLLDAQGTDLNNSAVRFSTLVAGELVNPEKITIEPGKVGSSANQIVSLGFSIFDKVSPELAQNLGGRTGEIFARIYGGLAAALLGLVASVGVTYGIARGLTNQTVELMNLFGEVGIGNFDARARLVTQDEIGTVAMSLNSMLDNTLSLIQSQDERDRIQQSIQTLMSQVATVASGDLTVQAEVKDSFTGSIADSINYMIGQLRTIVGNVQDATLHVSTSANEIQATTEHLSRGSEAQASQIVDTSAAIDEIATSINQVAENTTQSLLVAEQARERAKAGTEAVRDTIAGMERIREQVQETSKRIKRLGESSQSIGEIVQLIGDIADRTSILALNASIQAAMAGDAGLGFAVVAEEVERLAGRCNDATKQISALIKSIQSETSEAITAMEESTREVVSGSKIALQAGQSLAEIDAVSVRLAEIIQSITFSVKQQARGSEAVAKAMSEISEVTQQTAIGNRQAAQSVSSLAQLADDLRMSVSTFRLPNSHAGNGNGNGNGNGHNYGNGSGTFPAVGSGARKATRRPVPTSN